MRYFDVVFPLNLAPLTYRCPKAYEHMAQPGMIVSAPLKNKIMKGLLLERKDPLPKGKIKYFAELHGESAVLGTGLLKLLRWLSAYYLTTEGSVLMQSFPRELFEKIRMKKTKKEISSYGSIDFIPISENDITDITESFASTTFRTFLIHAPSQLFAYSLLPIFVKKQKNIIILLPEISLANLVFNSLKKYCRENICILHGDIARGRRSAYLEGILSGKYTIIVGTRSALFAPLNNVRSIIVLNEHSSSYKLEEGVRYNLRDVAVMRGFLEKAPVFLLSATPSIASYSNTLIGKYTLLTPSFRPKRPRIKIIDMRFEKAVKQIFSRSAYITSRNRIKEGKRVIFLINRRGYTTLFHCQECDHIESCAQCNIPLVFHKTDASLKCHYCGTSRMVPDRCRKCSSYHIELLGTGTQKVQEVLSEAFGVRSIRFDSDIAKKRTGMHHFLHIASSDSSKVLVGTKMITTRIGIADTFSLAVVLNADSYVNIPDFRAHEKAFMEFHSLMEHIDSKGEIIIQTRCPYSPLFKHLRAGDYEAFVKEELVIRKELNYPPHSQLLKIILPENSAIADKIINSIHTSHEDVEVLGPTEQKGLKRARELAVMLKARDRQTLNRVMQSLLSHHTELKNSIKVDRDPF